MGGAVSEAGVAGTVVGVCVGVGALVVSADFVSLPHAASTIAKLRPIPAMVLDRFISDSLCSGSCVG